MWLSIGIFFTFPAGILGESLLYGATVVFVNLTELNVAKEQEVSEPIPTRSAFLHHWAPSSGVTRLERCKKRGKKTRDEGVIKTLLSESETRRPLSSINRSDLIPLAGQLHTDA